MKLTSALPFMEFAEKEGLEVVEVECSMGSNAQGLVSIPSHILVDPKAYTAEYYLGLLNDKFKSATLESPIMDDSEVIVVGNEMYDSIADVDTAWCYDRTEVHRVNGGCTFRVVYLYEYDDGEFWYDVFVKC